MGSSKKTLITIVGPTAIGKTSLSILIASHFNTEVISCDSRQFYKEMTIGTAVPEKEELATVPHHFIQNRSIVEDYNVGAFEKDALTTLDTLFEKHNTVVMVGGSGLYVQAVLEGLDDFPKIDPAIRQELKNIYNSEGIIPLQQQLKKLDIETYNSIALDNPQTPFLDQIDLYVALGEALDVQQELDKAFRAFSFGMNFNPQFSKLMKWDLIQICSIDK